MNLADLASRLTQLRQLAEQVSGDAEVIASQQHDPHAAEAMRAISEGGRALAQHAQQLQDVMRRL